MSDLIRSADIPARVSHVEKRPDPLPASGEGWTGLRWVWSAIAKRGFLAVGILLSILVPAFVYVFVAKPTYRATASIQIDPESTKILPHSDIADAASSNTGHYELYIKTQDEILRSDLLRTRAAAKVRERAKAFPSAFVDDALASGPAVERVPGSLMLRVSCVAADPNLAAEIANAWAGEFVGLHREKRFEMNHAAAEFLRAQLKSLEAKMRSAEAELVNYAQEHSILNLDSGEANVVRQRFDYLSKELSRSEKDLLVLKAQYEGFRSATPESVPADLKNTSIASLEAKVFDAERELTQMLGRFGENWPAVAEKRAQNKRLKEQLEQAKRAAIGGVQAQAEMKYQAAKAEYGMLKEAVEAQAGVVARLNQDSLDYNSLRRDVQTSQQLYNGLLQRLKETGVSTGTEFGNIHLAVAAQPPTQPFRPRKGLTLAMALALGLSLVVGICGVLQSVKTSVEDPWEIEQLGVPLLGWVPKVAVTDQTGGGFPLLLTNAHSERRMLSGSAKKMRRAERTMGLAQECFRTLSSSIVLSRPGAPPQLILISSAMPQEGKSTTVASVGIAFAEMGWPTLLIDADLRRPTLASRFGIETREGLSTYLAGGKLTLVSTATPNLQMLPAGAIPPNSLALLNSQRMTDLLAELSKQFRFIIIDGPPVLSVADANVLGTKVHGVVMVVHAGKTAREVLKRALQSLRQTGANVLGASVNQVNVGRSGYGSYSNYYYYSSSSDDEAKAGTVSAV